MMCPLRAKEFNSNVSDQECQPDCAWLVDVYRNDNNAFVGRMCCQAVKVFDGYLYAARPRLAVDND